MCLGGQDVEHDHGFLHAGGCCRREGVLRVHVRSAVRDYVKPAHLIVLTSNSQLVLEKKVGVKFIWSAVKSLSGKKKLATIKTESQFDGMETALLKLKAWLEELSMRRSRNSTGHVEKCVRDSSIHESKRRTLRETSPR